MEKLLNVIEEKLREEAKDVIEYIRLSEEADEIEDNYMTAKLREAAYDEFTHAYTLCTILKYHGHKISEETMVLWERAKETFKEA